MAGVLGALAWRTLLAQPAATGEQRLSTPALTGTVSPPRSPRNANYTISARLEPSTRTLTASEVILWTNITAHATAELQLHAYWNAWRDTRSTFLRERAQAGLVSSTGDDFARLDISTVAVQPVRSASRVMEGAPPPTDVTANIRYLSPDDGNGDDRTVLQVPLGNPVEPGEALRIEVRWTARVPRPFARTGVIGQFYLLAQWFPKLGVLEESGWNCHQFHATTEFFSDYGVYDVSLTTPAGWTVGATGVERSRTENADATITHRYYQEDVHDFAWATSPMLVETVAQFTPAGPTAGPDPHAQRPVALRLLLQPEHRGQAERHLAAARKLLEYYSQWFGAYPYEQLTIVDPAFQSEADGMEYPTFVTAGTRWWIPDVITINTPEEVTMHEAGHQWFYGIVGTNEFEDAWMDEGINTYASARAMLQDQAKSYVERRYLGGFVPWVIGDLELSREAYWNRLPGYRRAAKSDLPSQPSFRYSVANGRTVTYNKTALWLNTLERHLGWPVMQRALAAYVERWQFKHPKPDDFFAIVNEAAGQDLTWFFDQVYRSSNVFDYAVESLTSTKVGASYHTEVVVRRNGEATFPLDLQVTFAGGEPRRERWDGRDRWRRYTFDGPSRAVSAEIDPDRVLLLDVSRTNNSITLEPQTSSAAMKWALAWMAWLEHTLLAWSFFA